MAIVHRKGATPAQKGQAGLIPGSMATLPRVIWFVVKGWKKR